jgi:hypothetical protein
MYIRKEDMKNHPSTENQLVKENDLLANAVCTFTAWYEIQAEEAFEKNDLRTAIRLYRDLIRVHKPKPLRASKEWIEQYEERLSDLYCKLEHELYA